eukprot:g4869.t1
MYSTMLTYHVASGTFHLATRVASADGTGWKREWITPVVVPTDGQWSAVGVVWTGDEILVYLNGINEFQVSLGDLGTIPPTSETLLVGASRDSNGRIGSYFEGSIDDLRIWESALSPDQMRKCATSGDIQQSDRIVGAWRFDEGRGFVLRESARGLATMQGVLRPRTLRSSVVWPRWAVSAAPIDTLVEMIDTEAVVVHLKSVSRSDYEHSVSAVLTALPFEGGTLFRATSGLSVDSVPVSISLDEPLKFVPETLENEDVGEYALSYVVLRDEIVESSADLALSISDEARATLRFRVSKVRTSPRISFDRAGAELRFYGYGVDDRDGWESLNALDVTLEVSSTNVASEHAFLSVTSTQGLNFGGQLGEGDGIMDRRMRFQGSLQRAEDALNAITLSMDPSSEDGSVDTVALVASDVSEGGVIGSEESHEFAVGLRLGTIPRTTALLPVAVPLLPTVSDASRLRVFGDNFGSSELECVFHDETEITTQATRITSTEIVCDVPTFFATGDVEVRVREIDSGYKSGALSLR